MPAHDTRDFAFAVTYGLPIPVVIAPPDWDGAPLREAYVGEGVMVNSGPFDGTPSEEGRRLVTEALERIGHGRTAVTYRLRDWLISRQRYWGTPIPIIYCPSCGAVPVPYADLPVLLPDDSEFLPTGESQQTRRAIFTDDVSDMRGSRRARDRHDGYVCRLVVVPVPLPRSPQPRRPVRAPWTWAPVDQYTGGIEHAVLHLMYTRFFTKAMRDLGIVWFDEPMLRLFSRSIILGLRRQPDEQVPGQRREPR